MRCPDCLAECPPGATVCTGCGAGLAPPDPVVTEERKVVSVLFADIRGSLSLIHGRDPEEARQLLAPTVALMAEAVRRFEGTVVQTLGDGIMAVFGAPHAQEDHAVRACHAALAMRDAAAGAEGRTGVAIRVGVNSGEVLFREARSGTAREFEAGGEAVHLAARMEQTARPATVRVTATTFRLAAAQFAAQPLGDVRVKGLASPVAAYELVAPASQEPPMLATKRRGLTPFVGRSAEMAMLEQALRRVAAGSGEVVALFGEPGCGKSRLVHEATGLARALGFGVLETGCLSYGRRASYLPLQALCRRLFGVAEGDDVAAVRERITRRLQRGQPEAGSDAAVAALAALVDSRAAADPAWRSLGPELRRLRLFEGMGTLLRSESRDRPVVLVIEDLQWADPETTALLDWLVGRVQRMPVLLLTNHRPEHGMAWSGLAHYTAIEIAPLAGEEARRLTGALLGQLGADEALAALVTERAGGNPFFAEEIVEALAEQGVLAGQPGAWRHAAPPEAPGVPPTVRAVLAARVDRLAPEDKRLLQSASAIGKDFALPLFSDVTGMAEARLRDALERLVAAQFLRHVDDDLCTFRHALTHEVVYAGVPLAQRRQMHGQIVDAIERVHAGHLVEQAETLARHAGLARRWQTVVVQARQAGVTALARSANRQAMGFFEQALAALRELPESDEVRRLAVDIRFDLRECLFRLGMLRRVVARLREAEPLAVELGDRARLGQLTIFLSHILWTAGQHTEAIREAHRAEAMAREHGDRALGWRARFQLGCAWMARGEYAAAAAAMDAVAAAIRDEPGLMRRYGLDPALAALATCYAARALSELGEFAAAEEAVAGSAMLAREVGRPFTDTYVELAAGYLALHGAKPAAAMQHFRRMLDLARAAEVALNMPVAMALLGEAALHAGLPAKEALGPLQEAVRSAEEMGLLFQQPLRLAWLAEAQARAGLDPGEAHRLAQRALRMAGRQEERGSAAHAARALGAISVIQGAAEAAERHYRRAARQAEALGMRPLLALCRLELGEFLAVSGVSPQAEEVLGAAAVLCGELGLHPWTSRAEAMRSRLGAGGRRAAADGMPARAPPAGHSAEAEQPAPPDQPRLLP